MRYGQLQEAFTFEPDWSSEPSIRAARVAKGWLVAGAQHGVRAVLSLVNDELRAIETRVVASGKDCDYRRLRPLPLPDGRCWLHALRLMGPRIYRLDPTTLEHAPASEWDALSDERYTVTELRTLGDRLIVGVGDAHGPRTLTVVPHDDTAAQQPFFADWEEQASAVKGTFAGSRSRFESIAVLGDRLLLTHRYFMRSHPVGHALLVVDEKGKLVHLLQIARADRTRFGEHDIQWFEDARRQRALLYGGRVLEVFDADLQSSQRSDGHALFKSWRPLAGDGEGGLLWLCPRNGQLAATDPDELDLGNLEASLDRLAKAIAAKKTKAKAKPAAAKQAVGTKTARVQIARPKLDLADIDNEIYRAYRDEVLALEHEPLKQQTLSMVHGIASQATSVVAYTSAVDREHRVLLVGTRIAAQCGTCEVLAHGSGDGDSVTVPIGKHSVTLNRVPKAASANTWAQAWYAASIVRDDASLERLASLSDDRVDDQGNADAFVSHWRAALKAFRVKPASALPFIARTREAIRQIRYSHAAVMLLLRDPLALMLQALAEQDAAGFQTALAKTLTNHKKYHGTPARRQHDYAMLAWGALALCCMAYDLGIPIEVESEYLLPGLIERRIV